MNGKEKKILPCLICMAVILIGMIAFIDAMVTKYGWL